MFQMIARAAHRSFDAIATKYVTRAAVALLFVVAAGFGLAAATTYLSAEFGAVTAYAIIAGVFAVVGLIAAATVTDLTSTPESSAPSSAAADPSGEGESASPLDGIDGTLLTDAARLTATLSSLAPALAGPITMRAITRNLPVLILVAILAVLLLSNGAREGEVAQSATEPLA